MRLSAAATVAVCAALGSCAGSCIGAELHAAALEASAMPQPWGTLNIGDRLVVLGLPTFGKTTLCEKLAARADAVLYVSPVRDYEKPFRPSLTVAELERYPDVLRDPHARIVAKLSAETGEQLADEVRRCIALAYKAGQDFDATGEGGRVLVLDEVGDYRRYLENELNAVFRRGRHYGIVPIFASQVATDIPLRARKLASQVLCLGQRHPGELRELAGLYGPEFARKVGAWRKYEAPVTWTAEATVSEEST